ncbi:asparagine synthetase B [Candidatus Nitrosomarinus catalina]|uniref:Asparagine synthetase B n=1 Tax=Candidatus Nitrosomarinus catalinensis TaxID=1898749 RepID=A0A2Z2HIN4_9ARCH|nr:asparagine synthase C-terminal domain-containing protein [Candidatus Nitrosomarinus catalina]ARS63755.1 asparagine synthetase B [Candidatus Nitrosomarinus catalina]
MEINNYSSIIKEVLTLRYSPSIDDNKNKFISNNFLPEEKLNYLEYIEKSISLKIENEVQDKHVSIALSGGVDSTLVMSLLRKTKPDIKIDAISLKFADSVDETRIAGNIANKFNADHNIISIENFLEFLPKAISIIKMPFWDTHWYHMVKTASKFSTSLVSGDGGDELFGGYTFRYQKYLSNFYSDMSPLDRVKLYLECHERDWVPDQIELFESKSNFSWDEIYSKIIPYFDNSLSPLDQVFLADINGKLLYNWIPLNTSFHNFFDLKPITPILSKELMQYAPHLKNSIKYNQNKNIGKLPLREILSKHISSDLITPNKQGFSVNTINLWNSYGKEICNYYLDNARIIKDKWINGIWVKKHLKRLDEIPDVRYVNKFLGLLAFEIWYRIFVTKEMNPETKLSI